eukprot:2716612-Rhodomonas_salina.2
MGHATHVLYISRPPTTIIKHKSRAVLTSVSTHTPPFVSRFREGAICDSDGAPDEDSFWSIPFPVNYDQFMILSLIHI